jgi:hypothetical protein
MARACLERLVRIFRLEIELSCRAGFGFALGARLNVWPVFADER